MNARDVRAKQAEREFYQAWAECFDCADPTMRSWGMMFILLMLLNGTLHGVFLPCAMREKIEKFMP